MKIQNKDGGKIILADFVNQHMQVELNEFMREWTEGNENSPGNFPMELSLEGWIEQFITWLNLEEQLRKELNNGMER